MSITRKTAAIALTALAATLATTSPAHAAYPDPDNTTTRILTNVTVDGPYAVNAWRYAQKIGSTVQYVYKVSVVGPPSAIPTTPLGRTCYLMRDNAVVADGPCRTLTAFDGMVSVTTGNYVLQTADGQRIASWTATIPSTTPRPLGNARCEIYKVKDVDPTRNGTSFRIITNGECPTTTGIWRYDIVPFGTDSGDRLTVARNGNTYAASLLRNRRGAVVNIRYIPNGWQKETSFKFTL